MKQILNKRDGFVGILFGVIVAVILIAAAGFMFMQQPNVTPPVSPTTNITVETSTVTVISTTTSEVTSTGVVGSPAAAGVPPSTSKPPSTISGVSAPLYLSQMEACRAAGGQVKEETKNMGSWEALAKWECLCKDNASFFAENLACNQWRNP